MPQLHGKSRGERNAPGVAIQGEGELGQNWNASFVGVCYEPKSYILSETVLPDRNCPEGLAVSLAVYADRALGQKKVLGQKKCWTDWKKVEQVTLGKTSHGGRTYEQVLSFEKVPTLRKAAQQELSTNTEDKVNVVKDLILGALQVVTLSVFLTFLTIYHSTRHEGLKERVIHLRERIRVLEEKLGTALVTSTPETPK